RRDPGGGLGAGPRNEDHGEAADRTGERGRMKLLIVDDHTLVRKGIATVLQQRFPDADVVEAEGADDAVETLRDGGSDVDIALVDVRIRTRDGPELMRETKWAWPEVRGTVL